MLRRKPISLIHRNQGELYLAIPYEKLISEQKVSLRPSVTFWEPLSGFVYQIIIGMVSACGSWMKYLYFITCLFLYFFLLSVFCRVSTYYFDYVLNIQKFNYFCQQFFSTATNVIKNQVKCRSRCPIRWCKCLLTIYHKF